MTPLALFLITLSALISALVLADSAVRWVDAFGRLSR